MTTTEIEQALAVRYGHVPSYHVINNQPNVATLRVKVVFAEAEITERIIQIGPAAQWQQG